MIAQSRHVPLRALPWDEADAAKAMEEIIADALSVSARTGSGLLTRAMTDARTATAASISALPG
jgi:hypothetical protein